MRRGETNNGNRCVCCETVVAKSEQQAYENPCSGRGSVSVYHKGQIYNDEDGYVYKPYIKPFGEVQSK